MIIARLKAEIRFLKARFYLSMYRGLLELSEFCLDKSQRYRELYRELRDRM